MSSSEAIKLPDSSTAQSGNSKQVGCLTVLLQLCLLFVGSLTLVAFLGRWHWAIELTTHFRVQYFGMATGLMILLVFVRRFRWAMLGFSTALINAVLIFPVYAPANAEVQELETIRILFANVYVGNRQSESVLQLVREIEPDIVLFAETHPWWIEQLDELKTDYPYSITESNRGAFGVAGYSRVKLDRMEIEWVGQPAVPVIVAETRINDRPIRIFGAHVASPGNRADLVYRTSQMQHLAEISSQREVPTAIIGDLNVTPWSPYFSDMIVDGQLHDSRQGFGNQASWPNGAALLRIPIDHCLVTEEITVIHREICRSVGSDHFPLLVELAIRTNSGETVESRTE